MDSEAEAAPIETLPKTGRDPAGVTKAIKSYHITCFEDNMVLVDTIGLGDLEKGLGSLIGGIRSVIQNQHCQVDGVIVTSLIATGRLGMACLLVQQIILNGLVKDSAGISPWERIIFCGTQQDRCTIDEIKDFKERTAQLFFKDKVAPRNCQITACSNKTSGGLGGLLRCMQDLIASGRYRTTWDPNFDMNNGPHRMAVGLCSVTKGDIHCQQMELEIQFAWNKVMHFDPPTRIAPLVKDVIHPNDDNMLVYIASVASIAMTAGGVAMLVAVPGGFIGGVLLSGGMNSGANLAAQIWKGEKFDFQGHFVQVGIGFAATATGACAASSVATLSSVPVGIQKEVVSRALSGAASSASSQILSNIAKGEECTKGVVVASLSGSAASVVSGTVAEKMGPSKDIMNAKIEYVMSSQHAQETIGRSMASGLAVGVAAAGVGTVLANLASKRKWKEGLIDGMLRAGVMGTIQGAINGSIQVHHDREEVGRIINKLAQDLKKNDDKEQASRDLEKLDKTLKDLKTEHASLDQELDRDPALKKEKDAYIENLDELEKHQAKLSNTPDLRNDKDWKNENKALLLRHKSLNSKLNEKADLKSWKETHHKIKACKYEIARHETMSALSRDIKLCTNRDEMIRLIETDGIAIFGKTTLNKLQQNPNDIVWKTLRKNGLTYDKNSSYLAAGVGGAAAGVGSVLIIFLSGPAGAIIGGAMLAGGMQCAAEAHDRHKIDRPLDSKATSLRVGVAATTGALMGAGGHYLQALGTNATGIQLLVVNVGGGAAIGAGSGATGQLLNNVVENHLQGRALNHDVSQNVGTAAMVGAAAGAAGAMVGHAVGATGQNIASKHQVATAFFAGGLAGAASHEIGRLLSGSDFDAMDLVLAAGQGAIIAAGAAKVKMMENSRVQKAMNRLASGEMHLQVAANRDGVQVELIDKSSGQKLNTIRPDNGRPSKVVRLEVECPTDAGSMGHVRPLGKDGKAIDIPVAKGDKYCVDRSYLVARDDGRIPSLDRIQSHRAEINAEIQPKLTRLFKNELNRFEGEEKFGAILPAEDAQRYFTPEQALRHVLNDTSSQNHELIGTSTPLVKDKCGVLVRYDQNHGRALPPQTPELEAAYRQALHRFNSGHSANTTHILEFDTKVPQPTNRTRHWEIPIKNAYKFERKELTNRMSPNNHFKFEAVYVGRARNTVYKYQRHHKAFHYDANLNRHLG